MADSFKARSTLNCGGQSFEYWNLNALGKDRVARLPYSLKVLPEPVGRQ
jgi:aconitase A